MDGDTYCRRNIFVNNLKTHSEVEEKLFKAKVDSKKTNRQTKSDYNILLRAF